MIFLAAMLWMGAVSSFGDEPIRPQNKNEIGFETEQAHYKLANAKVAWADYSALKRDFPALTAMSNDEIDRWVLDNFAYVSALQLKLQNIRVSQIPLAKGPDGKLSAKTLGHPPSYSRAAVASADYNDQTIGLIDLKGTGYGNSLEVQNQVDQFSRFDAIGREGLRTRDHSDGVMSLGEAVQEVTKQRGLQMEFDIANAATGTSYETVENYFIIDTGYDILKQGNETIPAGIVGRQAHWRGWSLGRSPVGDALDEFYTDPFGGKQASVFESSVDFGGVILSDPKLAENYSPLPGANSKDPQGHKPWAYGHDAARNFRNGDVSAIRSHVDYMVSPLQGDWEKTIALKKPLQIRQARVIAKNISLPAVAEFPKRRIMEFLEAIYAAQMSPSEFSEKELENLRLVYAKKLKWFVEEPEPWKRLSAVQQIELLNMNLEMIRASAQSKALPLIKLHEALVKRLPQAKRAKFRTYSISAARVCSFTNKIMGWLGLWQQIPTAEQPHKPRR